MKLAMQRPTLSRRRWLQQMASLAGLTLLAAALNGCGASRAGNEAEDGAIALTLGCDGDLLAFDQTQLSAPAGAAIALTFANRSNHHQHNWVLVNGGEETARAVYDAALAAGIKNDWLPTDSAQIIVHTPLLASGKSATIHFQAPAQPGDYFYLCTFPGHYLAGMKGRLALT
jgi:azurin